jgi:hypothetical protein
VVSLISIIAATTPVSLETDSPTLVQDHPTSINLNKKKFTPFGVEFYNPVLVAELINSEALIVILLSASLKAVIIALDKATT